MNIFPSTPGFALPGQLTPGKVGNSSLPPPPPPPSSVLNQWSGTLENDPGLKVIPIPGYQGNGLVAFIAWNDAYYVQEGVSFVADDAHDFWQPMVTTALAPSPYLQGAIWITTPNANPNGQLASCVSVCFTFPVSGAAILIAEITGLPNLAQQGFAPVFNSLTATSNTASATPASPVWAFGLAVTGDNLNTVTAPGAPWAALSQISVNDPIGAGGLGDTKVTPIFAQVNAGLLSATFTNSASQLTVVALGGILQSPAPVTNSNPEWPVFQVQAAFGAQVGSAPSTWTWTDISSRAIYDSSGSILDAQWGRSYELTGPESGTISIWLNNSDGALTPGNMASPYFPYVLPELPIRVLATWNNQVYSAAFGYVDKFPQSFGADSPQWGMANVSASDAMGVLANLTLYSAYQSEVLLDSPYAYWTFAESYGEANGLPFDNLGTGDTNTKPMVGYDGQNTGSGPLQTGETLNMQGDAGSGIGLSSLTTAATTWASGAICVDPDIPQMGNGYTVEFWAVIPPTAGTNGSFLTALVSLLGSPTNFGSGAGPVRFQVAAVSGNPHQTQVSMGDFQGHSFSSNAFSMPQDGLLHHHVFSISYVSPTWSITHFLDGIQDTVVNNSTVGFSSDLYQVAVGPVVLSPLAATPYNYTIAHLAIYGYQLDQPRILAHWMAGAQGFANDLGTTRFKRIMAWSQAGLPMAATPNSAAPQLAAAFSVGGQAVTDAFNDLLVTEGGWPYADSAGNVWWISRTWLYNRSPKWTFGDNPANGEIPYLPDQAFDFDNSYLYTQAQVTREIGQSSQITTSATQGVNALTYQDTGAIVRAVSQQAQNQYGRRNPVSQTIFTNSDQDVYDRGFWSLQKYSSGYLRVPQIVVDAAARPSLWPVVLGAEVGDIVRVNRRPLGGAPYSMLGIIVQVHLEVNVADGLGRATFGIVPYNVEANVIQVDTPGFNTLANGIGW